MNKLLPTYVIDTNVLLDDTKVFERFEKCNIVLPFIVIEELDKHKVARGELGAKARTVIRQLDMLSEKGNLLKGVLTGNKVKVSVCAWDKACKDHLLKNEFDDIPDNKILATLLAYSNVKKPTILITNDVSLRIKALSLGIVARAHVSDKSPDNVDEIYSGLSERVVDGSVIDNLHANGYCAVPAKMSFLPNEYVHLIDIVNDKHTGLARYEDDELIKANIPKQFSGIKPKNAKQAVAMDALMNPDITMVSLIGTAGSGKTLISLAAAVELVLTQKLYDKIILVKAPISVGPEIGFLPGSVNEKLWSYYYNFFDNFPLLFSGKEQNTDSIVEHLISIGKLELAPPTFMRGRSISNAIIIVDEFQNNSKHVAKTILTRVGENCRIFCLGDINQIDVKEMDAFDNGLTYILEAFKDEDCAAHITFDKSERSNFAELAANKL